MSLTFPGKRASYQIVNTSRPDFCVMAEPIAYSTTELVVEFIGRSRFLSE